jgi:hypothetical protein
MRLDTDPFPVHMVDLEKKKILVRTDQAETTKGKNMVVSDKLRNRMIKPCSPEMGVWKENISRKTVHRVKPTSGMLIEMYVRQREERRVLRASGTKRERPARYYNVGFQMGDQHGQSWWSRCRDRADVDRTL